MAFNYPIQLNISNRDCLIVGAGKVALRKVNLLLAAGAQVTVIAPAVLSSFWDLNATGLTILERSFTPDDVRGRFLVFAATSDREVNQMVATSAKEYGALVNVADSREESDFILPALLQKDGLSLAITTDGKSPIFAKTMKEYLQQHLDDRFIDAMWVSVEVRQGLRAKIAEQPMREALLRQLNLDWILELLETHSKEEVVRKVTSWLLS